MDSLPTTVVICILSLLLTFVVAFSFYEPRKRQNSNLPPGPPRLPFLGNVLQMPTTHLHLTYSKWAKAYGNVVYAEIFGRPLIILSSPEVVNDLLDKRSSIYSDRPRLVMAGELTGMNRSFVLRQYGDEWRKQRRFISQYFAPGAVSQYYSIQENEACKLTQGLLDGHKDMFHLIKWKIGSIILRVTYGYKVESEDDPFLNMSLQALDGFSKAAEPGAWLVDFIPQLKHMAMWLPGSGFLRVAAEWRQVVDQATYGPFFWCKNGLEMGVVSTSNICASLLAKEDGQMSKEDEISLMWATGSVLGGGLDTNMSSVLTFFLAMISYPEIQAKARAEIDSIVGPDRLPSISDQSSLPYMRSVIAEVFRWHPTTPTGLSHSVDRDDVYNGMYIPKGSLIIPNVWHMLHDPTVYANPEEFIPERYNCSDSEMDKVINLIFGFGRRICPGMYFAQGTIFSIVTTVLATCEIVPALDATGQEIIPRAAYTSGIIVFPEPFEFHLKSRSAHALELLSQKT